MKTAKTALCVLVCWGTLLCVAGSFAADWGQWRGPHRDGISQETGLLKEWPKDGPRLIWQVKDLGAGYSTPSVVGNRLYLINNKGLDDEYVQALKTTDGSQVWVTRIGKTGNPNQRPPYPGARSTPTVDGELLYALGSDGDLACLVAATGEMRWEKSLRKDFGGIPGEWAYAESPLIDGDAVVCTPGGAEATLLKLNKKSGDVIWKCPVPGGEQAAYASVVVDTIDGKQQYVQFPQNGVVGVDAASGKFLWRYDATAKGSPANIPTPLAAGALVYSASKRAGGGLIRLKDQSGAFEPQQIYFSSKLPSAIGGAVKLGDYLYGTNSQAMVCADFNTGDVKWTDRSIGAGGICYADGCLYLHGENNGDVALIKVNPEKYDEKGRFTPADIPDRGKSLAWAYPVVAGGRLYIHDWGVLWCYDVKDPQATK